MGDMLIFISDYRFVFTLIYVFIQHIFIKCLLCVLHGGNKVNEINKICITLGEIAMPEMNVKRGRGRLGVLQL